MATSIRVPLHTNSLSPLERKATKKVLNDANSFQYYFFFLAVGEKKKEKGKSAKKRFAFFFF